MCKEYLVTIKNLKLTITAKDTKEAKLKAAKYIYGIDIKDIKNIKDKMDVKAIRNTNTQYGSVLTIG